MSIYVTGSTGFLGSHLIKYFKHKYHLNCFRRGGKIDINEDVVIHLAGKAHDVKNVTNPDEYYTVNTELTKKVFDEFIDSNAHTFVFVSSIKAVVDSPTGIITESLIPNPKTHYGKSKLNAEKYILANVIDKTKRVFILRPCMIHGEGNKGNLNTLYKFVTKKIPWVLGSFENKRSFCTIDNFLFVINEIIENRKIDGDIYHIADKKPLSTNKIIELIAKSSKIKCRIWKLPRPIVYTIFKIFDILRLQINSNSLQKLTESYVLDNSKLINALSKELPYTSEEGILKTLNSFENENH